MSPLTWKGEEEGKVGEEEGEVNKQAGKTRSAELTCDPVSTDDSTFPVNTFQARMC